MATPESFVALYEREAEPVLAFLARRTLDDVEVALDLAAETFAQSEASAERSRTRLVDVSQREGGRRMSEAMAGLSAGSKRYVSSEEAAECWRTEWSAYEADEAGGWPADRDSRRGDGGR